MSSNGQTGAPGVGKALGHQRRQDPSLPLRCTLQPRQSRPGIGEYGQFRFHIDVHVSAWIDNHTIKA